MKVEILEFEHQKRWDWSSIKIVELKLEGGTDEFNCSGESKSGIENVLERSGKIRKRERKDTTKYMI